MSINFNKAEFVLSAVKKATFVRDGRPQITFAGRSNVGKSSVINRLVNRKNFARVGATPGKTSQINYFLIDKQIYFTDLPGYGYAKVYEGSEDEKKARVFLASLGIDYDSLTQEEFVTVINVLKKSAHMKSPYSQRGKAPYRKRSKGKKH